MYILYNFSEKDIFAIFTKKTTKREQSRYAAI